MEEEKEERGFTVSDKRFSAREDRGFSSEPKKEEPAEKPQEGTKEERREAAAEGPAAGEQETPPMNFASFIFSLSNSALFHLGELQEPGSERTETNLPLARQTIDILGMLKEKTEGNLTEEEKMLLEDLLYDLRMRYVKKAGSP
jgi:hypothetical protein